MKHLGIFLGILFAVGCAIMIAKGLRTESAPASDEATRQKIIRFVRARFGVPDSVKMTADPLQPSLHPDFLRTTITSDDGKQKHPNQVLVSKDRRYLILGNLFAVGSDPQNEMIQRVREQFKVPATTNITASPPRNSPYPNLLATTFTVDDGKQKQTQDFYVTTDNHFFVLGTVFNLTVDPKGVALRVLTTANQPIQGSLGAPVTIVEFSDLQCPTCAHLHEFLENDLLPKYGSKVRVVYKEFPLASIHDWTLTASVANQCAYQIDPATYVPYRTLIFKNQSTFNAANARDLLINYGEQVGLDRLRLAACIDSKASLPRVEQNFREGQEVGVQSTPTSFINGKMLVGMGSTDFYNAVDDALRAAR